MYCPICKAEYRAGFTTCSDCHADLVADSTTEAAVTIWKGTNQATLNQIAASLNDAGIPHNAGPYMRPPGGPIEFVLTGGLVGKLIGGRSVQDGWHVQVLASDFARAQSALTKGGQRSTSVLSER
jgi:hypothetical protein